MSVIYEPKGAALEYSPLACNLWLTCEHKCTYCYSPAVLHKKPENFFKRGPARKNILHLLEEDCKKMRGDKRPILLCFVTDSYQPCDEKAAITRQALEIIEKYDMTAQILTKGGCRACRDFDIIKRNGWKFGSTIQTRDCAKWEPYAEPLYARIAAINTAKAEGIYTWVSVEPVTEPYYALDIMEGLLEDVDFWKIGKLNHYKEQEKKIDWSKFIVDVEKLLKGKQYYIKTDLMGWKR